MISRNQLAQENAEAIFEAVSGFIEKKIASAERKSVELSAEIERRMAARIVAIEQRLLELEAADRK